MKFNTLRCVKNIKQTLLSKLLLEICVVRKWLYGMKVFTISHGNRRTTFLKCIRHFSNPGCWNLKFTNRFQNTDFDFSELWWSSTAELFEIAQIMMFWNVPTLLLFRYQSKKIIQISKSEKVTFPFNYWKTSQKNSVLTPCP